MIDTDHTMDNFFHDTEDCHQVIHGRWQVYQILTGLLKLHQKGNRLALTTIWCHLKDLRRGKDQDIFANDTVTTLRCEMAWIERHIMPIISGKLYDLYRIELDLIEAKFLYSNA